MTQKLRIALCALAVLVLAAACGKKEETLSRNCDSDIASGYCDSGGTKCTVKVAISACGVQPTTTPEKLHVCKQNTKITWTLAATGSASGAKFAPNGVDFKGNPEFEHPKPGNTEFEWMDKHSRADPEHPAKYDLHVLTKDASTCVNYDPYVFNE